MRLEGLATRRGGGGGPAAASLEGPAGGREAGREFSGMAPGAVLRSASASTSQEKDPCAPVAGVFLASVTLGDRGRRFLAGGGVQCLQLWAARQMVRGRSCASLIPTKWIFVEGLRDIMSLGLTSQPVDEVLMPRLAGPCRMAMSRGSFRRRPKDPQAPDIADASRGTCIFQLTHYIHTVLASTARTSSSTHSLVS